MKYAGSFSKILLLFVPLFLLSGCVKDIDFYRAEQISLSPDLQIDLLIYDITKENFINSETKEFNEVIRDTVRLEFLDDDYIQNDLREVDFLFRHVNTFSQSFTHRIKFLAPNGRTQFTVDYLIAPGSPDNPVETEVNEYIGEDRIGLVRNSIQMVVELEMLPGDEEVEGELEFASKGLFMFEF